MERDATRADLDALLNEARLRFAEAITDDDLVQAKAAYLGRQGFVRELMARMRELDADGKKAWGAAVNAWKDAVEASWEARRAALMQARRIADLATQREDLTLPTRAPRSGARHPLRIVEDAMLTIFEELGYDIATGPQWETDFHNFEALNFPPDHPARDMQDTFHVREGGLLRTHTSCVQIRTLLANKPPVRIVAPGGVFRSDPFDARHSPAFHQLEGLVIDRNITMAHLKGTLEAFVERFFGERLATRFRPSFFPFTEPSAEVDVQCPACHGDGCRVCSHTGWLEILGSGMVHPKVLEAVGLDPTEWQGFAFGIGFERNAMRLFEVHDIRTFYENDQRFLAQFI